jgi:vesicle coat complex subunit
MVNAAEIIERVADKDAAVAEPASRALRELARSDPASLARSRKNLLLLAMRATDLRVRWNLIIVIGKLSLSGSQRAAAIDFLFERLRDESSLTRTFALQALVDLSIGDLPLRKRMMPIVKTFAADGTAAMRAKARKLLKHLSQDQ